MIEDIQQNKEAYLSELTNNGYSEDTVRSYSVGIARWLAHVNATGLFDMESFFARLNRESISSNTQAHYARCIRLFMVWHKKKNIPAPCEPDAIPYPRTSTGSIIEPLSEAQVREMIDFTDNKVARATISALFYSGMRIGELLSLRFSDWVDNPMASVNRHVEITIKGKGGRIRTVFIHKNSCEYINDMVNDILQRRNGRAPEALFPYSSRWLRHMIEDISYRALDKHVHPHQLRHSFAVQMLNRGVDIRRVAEFLGHANVATTHRYLGITNKDLRDTYDNVWQV